MTPKWQATIKDLPPSPGAFTPAGKTVVEGLPAAAILDSVYKLVGIIRAVRDKRQSRLFAIVDGKPWFIVDETSLIAFLAAQSTDIVPFDWMIGKGLLTKREFFQYASQAVEQYDSVSELPHFPPIPGVFYTAANVPTGDGRALDQLVSYYAAWSSIDYRLIRAIIVTTYWGGPPGSRPAFLFRASDDDEKNGRGVGKTTLAELVARMAGGLIAINGSGSIDELPTRLLSPDAEGKRVVLMDNIKTERFSNGLIEAYITAVWVSGRRLFHGEGSILNLFTYIFTMNNGSLSKDLAQRCYIIKLKRPEGSISTWRSQVEDFIDNHREAIIADCKFVIERAASLDTSDVQFTRWSRWETGVLAGCVDSKSELIEVLAEITRRQDADDGEDSDVTELRSAMATLIERHGVSPDFGEFEFEKESIVKIARDVLGGSTPNAALMALARHRVHIPQLVKINDSAKTCYFWIGAKRGDKERLEMATAMPLRDAAKASKGEGLKA